MLSRNTLEEALHDLDKIIAQEDSVGNYLHQSLVTHVEEDALEKIVHELRTIIDEKQR